MRFLFLNQYFPPDPAPTGALLAELADSLRSDGHSTVFTAARQDYRAAQRARGRLWRELIALTTMLKDGFRQPAVDVVVSASSPPCLLVVATILALRKRAKSIHWAMDLYPDLAAALGEVPFPLVTNGIARAMGICYRRTTRVVALDSDMARRLRDYGVEPEVVRPWVLKSIRGRDPDSPVRPQEPWTWIYSGNLGRAHEWETLLEVQAILEARGADIRLLFQGGGPSWPAAQARAEQAGLRRCEWQPYVPDHELVPSLLRCHCSVVTQRPVTRGLLWPSKLAMVLTLPRPILWIGPEESAIADELRSCADAGVFAPGRSRDIADWLLRRRSCSSEVASAFDRRSQRLAALSHWKRIVTDVIAE